MYSYEQDGMIINVMEDFDMKKQSKDIRPNEEQRQLGIENGWDGIELERGYGVFNDGDFDYIAKIDDMGVFDSDLDAVKQAKRDGYKFLKLTKKDLRDCMTDSITQFNVLDTEENRDYLDFVRGKISYEQYQDKWYISI